MNDSVQNITVTSIVNTIHLDSLFLFYIEKDSHKFHPGDVN